MSHSNSDNSNGENTEPQAKRRRCVEFEPVRICSISGVKDIDNKVLKAQHYKLCERYRYKERLRQMLEKRVEELEGRQAKDDEVSCIINRYWNRLDEDVQLLLERFDADSTLSLESKDNDTNVKHFLTVLSNWGLEEVEEKLSQRVEFTRRALTKLVNTFDKVVQKNQNLSTLISGDNNNETFHPSQLSSPNDAENSAAMNLSSGDVRGPNELESSSSSKKDLVEQELRQYTTNVLNENVRLQRLITFLEAENHRLTIKSSSQDDRTNIVENQVETLTNRLEDVRYELNKSLLREEKLDYRLAEYVRKEQTLQVVVNETAAEKKINGLAEETANVSKSKLTELQQELDIQTELASTRLIELQEMTERNKSLKMDLETCQMNLKYIPSDVIKLTPDYMCIQSNFSSLLDDCRALRQEADDLKQQLINQKQLHAKEIEKNESEYTMNLDRRQEMVSEREDQLITITREYESICIEFEQTNAANEQNGPINEHNNILYNTYATQNAQLKQDIIRYKRKLGDALSELETAHKELEMERKINNENYLIIKLEEEPPEITSPDPQPNNSNNFEGIGELENHLTHNCSNGAGAACNNTPNSSFHNQTANTSSFHSAESQDLKIPKTEMIADCSLDGTSACSLSQFNRIKMERNKLKEKLQQLIRMEKKDKMSYYAEEAKRKLKHLEDKCEKLRHELSNAKQVEDALSAEMESTGLAFEELQEQNQKLVQQLREKDEANLKLMAERIRTNHAQNKMKEEKETADSYANSLVNELAAKTLLSQKLEEKEKSLMEHRATLEQELKLREQANELLKRKAAESTQSANDLRLRLDKLTSQFNEVQENVIKKAASHEVVAMKIKRLEEEKSSLKRQCERAKRMEKFENIDELIKEENRLYKETLTCPSCKVHPKNAILTKCWHVFCFDCLKLRYDTRRRKCPKCNAGFGANDFRRIYIE